MTEWWWVGSVWSDDLVVVPFRQEALLWLCRLAFQMLSSRILLPPDGDDERESVSSEKATPHFVLLSGRKWGLVTSYDGHSSRCGVHSSCGDYMQLLDTSNLGLLVVLWPNNNVV